MKTRAEISRIVDVRLHFLPVRTRMPLKFGNEVLTSVTCARVALVVEDKSGRIFEGWGETPLSVQWVWPSPLPYESRHEVLKQLCKRLAREWLTFEGGGDALWMGHNFIDHILPRVLHEVNGCRQTDEAVPLLAALLCDAPFDIALHDAFGKLTGRSIYQAYGPETLGHDLADYLEPRRLFRGRFPGDYLRKNPETRLAAWHLVGGLDPIDPADLDGSEPKDGYPVLLRDWIHRDGLKCLKVKLRGTDAAWDYGRMVAVGRIGLEEGVSHLSADFNCTVLDPAYVCDFLDRLRVEESAIYARLLYIEQPFPYELEPLRIDVREVSRRKPCFLDESAHNWSMVRLGHSLGWTGVALKTCKTQTGAILSACWSKAHGMSLMVQDLTNPMLAQIPHALLAAYTETIMGVETNSMQFYPDASTWEARVHRGLYCRVNGCIDLSTVAGQGFGYKLGEINRPLPPPEQLGPV